MKPLCVFAISVMMLGFSSTVRSQTMKERLQAQKEKLMGPKKGRVCAPDVTDEEVFEFLGGGEPDDGIISAFHEANIGKIVFTKTKMEPKDVTAADVVTEFSINDPIYFTYFMDKSYRNQVMFPVNAAGDGLSQDWCWDHSFHKFYEGEEESGVPQLNYGGSNSIYFEMDGKEVTDVRISHLALGNMKATAYTGEIARDTKVGLPGQAWMDFMKNLEEGSHELKFEIAGYHKEYGLTKKLVAKGGFTLKKAVGEKYFPVLGKSWADYKAKKNDATLEAEFLKQAKIYTESRNYTHSVTKLKIDSYDWGITRSDTYVPVITGRVMIAYCYLTSPDGICKVQSFEFRQEYDGSGYQSTISCVGVYQDRVAINCD